MPIYRVQAPDGNVYKIEGPANANHEDLFRTIAEQNPMAAKTTQELQAEKSAPTSISDLARTAGSSLVGAGKSLVDVFGAGSDISSYLGDVAQKLEQGKTPERLAEIARRQELSKRAEKEGTWAQIKSGLAGVAEAPIESLVSGVFSAAPTIATGAAALAALPASAPAALAVGVQRASQILIAAAQGTGEVKGDIHDAIKQAYKEKNPNMAPEEVERLATEAQAYTLKNAPTLIGGAAFGALDALTGFEKSTSKALRSAFDTEKKAFTKEGLQAAIAQLPEKAVQAPTYLGQAFKTGIGEAIPEGLQGGYGQLAQNVAMTQAGFETPTFQGVAGAAARDALVGALTGTAMSPLGRSVANAEFEADKYLRGVKAEQELQTQREEFAKQQEQTKENLGVGKTLALGYEPKAEEEKYTNPAATITKDMLTKRGGPASQELKFVDEYRKQNGLPPLKAYSIEDIKDAMPGIDPEGEQGRIDSILAAVYDYKPVDDITGKPVNYTPDDVVSAAEDEKNIATGTKGFSDFLTRVTGSSDLNTMSQPQLFAAFQAVKQMPESEEKQILPEGTGASRFTDKQYKQAVSWFSQTFEQFDNKPLSRETIVQDIQEATGLEQKQDAEALLNTAVKNGDLAETEEKVFRTYDDNGKLVSTYRDKAKADAAAKKQGLNVKEERLKQLTPPPAAQPAKRLNLPAGYEMTKETVKEGEIPAGFEIYPEGRGKALVTVPTEAELQAKVESLTGARKNEAAKTLANMNRDISTLKKARDSLESMEARGEVGSQAYELAKTRLAKQERVLGKRIERHKERIEGYEAPLKTRPTEAKKQVTREKITVTKGGKSLGSFPDNVKAQEAILVQMTDEELAATASDGRLGAIADRAALEIERRKQPAGIIVKRTPKAKEELPPLSPELQAAADEIAKKLVPILQRMGLGDVGLKIVQSIKNGGEGSYTKNLIKLAIDADKPLEVMHHESLHALKDLGFFTDQQWATLEKQAEKVWINKYLKSVQVEVDGKFMSRYDGYVYLNKTAPEEYNRANPNKPQQTVMSDADLQALLREEAIADAFADFATTKPPGGMIASIMKRLNDLFKAIKNAFNRSGFESAEDIFGKAQRGELRGTKQGTEAEKASLRIPLSTRAIMEQNDAFAQSELGLTENPVFLTYDPKTGQVVSAHKKLEAAQARAKKDDLKVRRGFENNVRDVAIALNNETRTQHGVMDQKTLGSADSDALAKAMADEVGYQLRAMSKTGTGQGWYSNNYPNAVKRLSKRFPELGSNKHARSVFSALVAITSNGEDVSTNIGNAIYYYSKLRMGKPLVALGNRRASALENNLQQLEDLLKTYGKDFEKVLMEEITVKDMNAYLRSIGEKTSSDYLADTVIPKAAIYFGPKLGAFYANLSGSEGYLTMDLWWTRTMNRMRGLLLPEATKSSIDSFREMIGEPNASKEKIVQLTIPLRNKYEEFGWKTELEHLVGAKEPSTNADKPKWNRRAKKLAGDAYEQLMFDHKLEKMANTIYKNEFETLEEAPFSASDRKFMYDAARKTQFLLRKEGINLSLADIQAALWYYEKRLYAKLKGGKPDDIGYEEAIIENANKASRRERPSVVFPEQPNGGDVSQAEVADSDAIGGSSASGEEKYSLRGIIAEVAPHPDQDVVNRWREMTPSERLAATTNVANKTMRRIFDELGFSGYTYKFSTGKYEGEQNPNILVEAPDNASIQDLNKLARVMGYVFDQKAMIAYDETNTTSDDQGSFVKVIIPDNMSPTDLERLRDLIGNTVPQAEGDTLRDGALIFGNFSAFNDNIETLDDKQFRKALVDAVESFDYDGVIQVSEPETFHSQYIWPDNRDGYLEGTEYGNGRDFQGEEGRDVRGGGRSRLEAIAQEAISLRDRWIDARGAARIGSGTKFDKVAVPEPTAEYGEPTEGSVSAVGVHFSKQPRPTLVSSMYGTGLKGAELERLIDAPDIRPRIYFYVDKGNGIRPEAGVGGSPHVVRLNNLYDASSDPKGIIKNNTGTTLAERLNNLERSIVESGYDGYLSKDPLLDQGFAVLVGKHNVETNVKLSLRKAPDTPAFKRWFGDSKAVDENGDPQVMYHGTSKDFNAFKAGLIFASPNPMVANKFAANDMLYSPEKPGIEPGANVMPVYIKTSNPFDYENPEHVNELFEKIKTNFAPPSRAAAKRLLSEGQFKIIEENVDTIKELGFDGLYVEEFGEKNLAVFEPNQVKSATGNQGTFSAESPDVRLSLRSTRQPPDSKEFKNWFTGSYFTSNGEPLIMYHGTARDITIFKGKQAKAIFVTTDPEVAHTYADMGVDYMRAEAYKALTRDEKVELITTVAEQAERDGTIDRNELKEITSNLKKRVPPIDPEKNRILDLPYQIEGEIIESLNNLLPTKGNIMPVYVNAKNIFDYANKDDVNRVYDWMMNNSSALGRMENPERWLSSVKSLISRGNWPRIESPEVQEAIRALGFDGFSVLEAGTKNYAVYNPTAIKSVTGNIGTFGLGEVSTEQAARFGMTPEQARQAQAEGDIRFSLKKVDNFFNEAEKIPEPQGVEIIRDNWIGGVSGVGYRDSAYDLQRVNGGKKYMKDVQDLVRKELGDNFKGYRLMHVDELEEIQTGAMGSQLASFTLRPDIAKAFANLATYRKVPKDKLKVVEMDLTPEHIWMIGHPAERELVVDYGQGYNPSAVNEYKEKLSLKKVPIGIPENVWDLHNAYQEAEGKATGTTTSQQKTAATKAFKRLSKAAEAFTGNQQDALKLMQEMNTISGIRQAMAEDDTSALDTYKVSSPALWRQETGEKLSLRATTPAAINSAVERTTTAREQKGFIERMMDAISPKSWSDFRSKAMNRYDAMSVADKIRAQKMGGAALLADQSAEAAALMSDLAAGVTASALGVHDRHGGAPVFRNGITTIDSSIKGPVAIFAPLAKYGDPYVYQLWQFYAGAKRGRRLFKEGREENYKPSDFPLADQLAKQYPEFKQIFDEWNKFNDALVQYQIDTGVLSKERADEYRKYSDYIPFYRQLEGEPTVGPRVFQSISGVKPTAKLKGAELPIADLMETIVRNVQSGIQAGMKNHAARQAIKVFSDIQQAAPAPQNSTSPYVVHVLENGVKTAYDVADHALFNSMQSLNLPDLPFIGFFAGPANLLRNLVTKDPGFMLANMVRDSMSAWVTSGVKMTPVASAVKNFTGALRGTSPEFQALLNAGVLGGYEFSQNVEASGKQLQKELAKYGPSTTLGKIKKPFTSVWEALEKGTTASDAATRMEVYKNVLAETGNEAEATFRALEVMNFNRKGSSAVIRILTAAVPFLNARIQGLDVLYRASFGKMATQDAKAIQKSFFIRGATIMALSMIYWGLTHDDDDYKKQEQETRDNYWLVPSLGIKIPIPFEVGVIFKVIPERIAEYAFGTDTGKDFANAMTRALVSTFAFNPIPQTILPLVEAKADYSFFTGRSILGQGMKNIAPEYQIGPNTSNLAKWFASLTGGMTMLPDYLRSPAMIDHIIGGYTGTFGMYAADAIDAIVSANSDVPKASKRFEQMPVLRRFLLDPEARGNVTAYYDLKNTVDEAVRTSNFLERTMSFEDLAKYNTDVVKTLAVDDLVKSMDKDMKELNNFAVQIRSSPIESDEKRDLLRAINQAQNNMTANIKLIKKSMD